MKKTIAIVALVVLVAVASVLGTLAYLTSTDTVKNTFTVGKVNITLDEAEVDMNGVAVTPAKRVKKNEYKLMPGHEYTKDPTVTVLKGSEESYVRMLVTVTFEKPLTDAQLSMNLDSIFTGYSAKWVRAGKEINTAKTVITYEYRYDATVSADETDNKLEALFTGIKIPDNWENDDLAAIGGFEIEIVAQAVQADGFDDADAAFAAGFPTPSPAPVEP